MKAVVDNDILLKGACYGLLDYLISPVCGGTEVAGVLGSARFVVRDKIQNNPLRRDRAMALAAFSDFLNRTTDLEPTETEQSMAADLEIAAQRAGLNLDAGESQLCAILVNRLLPWLLTGDKRAIIAMDRLVDLDSRLDHLNGKVRCLEQLVLYALNDGNRSVFRTAVCSEPEIDKALSICFSCQSEPSAAASTEEGLRSYIRALRTETSRVLSP